MSCGGSFTPSCIFIFTALAGNLQFEVQTSVVLTSFVMNICTYICLYVPGIYLYV